jgi:hypothetical protein
MASSVAGKQQWVLEETEQGLLLDKRSGKAFASPTEGQWPRLVGQLDISTGAVTVRPFTHHPPDADTVSVAVHRDNGLMGRASVSLIADVQG